MTVKTVHEIERAIEALTPSELKELSTWLDENLPHPIDARVELDLAAGKLDSAIQRALDDEASGRSRPL